MLTTALLTWQVRSSGYSKLSRAKLGFPEPILVLTSSRPDEEGA
jgi:hypothetical protein